MSHFSMDVHYDSLKTINFKDTLDLTLYCVVESVFIVCVVFKMSHFSKLVCLLAYQSSVSDGYSEHVVLIMYNT